MACSSIEHVAMPPSSSLGFRAALAVALTLGFYVLALGLGGALVALLWLEWHYFGRLHLRLAVGAVLLGVRCSGRSCQAGADAGRSARLFTELGCLQRC